MTRMGTYRGRRRDRGRTGFPENAAERNYRRKQQRRQVWTSQFLPGNLLSFFRFTVLGAPPPMPPPEQASNRIETSHAGLIRASSLHHLHRRIESLFVAQAGLKS